jgi:hypothetical protein
MKRLAFAVACVVALLIPATAAAKGPSEATVTGPGLSSALTIRGDGEGGNATDLGLLVEQGGFFPEVYGAAGPYPLLAGKPDALGPRFSVAYVVPGGPSTDTLQQDLYPYAKGGPVTYMQAGQRFWQTQRTNGGWYRGNTELRTMLFKAGLPKAAVTPRARSRGHRDIAVGTGAGILLVAGAFALLRRRR